MSNARDNVSRTGFSNAVTQASIGAVADGVTDVTAALTAGLQAGGEVLIPEGRYLIAATGPDSGGVEVTLTKSLRVVCHPNAVFVADTNLDNDMIRILVPSNGAGLPADKINVEWIGGIFDQRAQRNSTVTPFPTDFPLANPGASATCDGLSIRGDYLVGGVTPAHGIRSAVVKGAVFISGDHWETAGGDGNLFIGGCKVQRAEGCYHIGARDLGVYFSGDPTGALSCQSTAINNTYEHCFGGASAKRSSHNTTFLTNTFIDCPRAMALEHLVGTGQRRAQVRGNILLNCSNIIRGTLSNGVIVDGNIATDHGAMLSDGVTPVGSDVTVDVGFVGVHLRGCKNWIVKNNQVVGVQLAYQTAYASTAYMLQLESEDPGTGAVDCTGNLFSHNYSDSMRRGGTDHAGADGNRFIENLADNAAVVSSIVIVGTNSQEIRVTPVTNVQVFNTPVQYADGSAAAPTIARRSANTTGMFFGTNKVGLTVAGTEKLAVTNLGFAVNGNTPVARSVYSAPSGTLTRTTFNTATATTQDVAERLAAVITDIKATGIFG